MVRLQRKQLVVAALAVTWLAPRSRLRLPRAHFVKLTVFEQQHRAVTLLPLLTVRSVLLPWTLLAVLAGTGNQGHEFSRIVGRELRQLCACRQGSAHRAAWRADATGHEPETKGARHHTHHQGVQGRSPENRGRAVDIQLRGVIMKPPGSREWDDLDLL